MKEPIFVFKSNATNRHNAFYRPHPGLVFKRRFMSGAFINNTEVASSIGLSEVDFIAFINCRLDLDATLAEQIALYSGIDAETWLYYQRQYNLFKTPSQSPND